MKAVILAGGDGRRLEPITSTRNKALVPILDAPLLDRTISILNEYADEICLVGKDSTAFGHAEGVRYVKQGSGYGSGAALRSVVLDDDILVVYGDTLFEGSAIAKLSKAKGNAILGVEVADPRAYGVLLKDPKGGFLKGILEKPSNPPSNIVNGGLYKFTPEIYGFLDKVKMSERGEIELTNAVSLMAAKSKVNVIKHEGLWMDIGTPWNLLEANQQALNLERERRKGTIESNVRIVGKAIIEEGAVVKSGTYIEGPAYIGRGAEVGPNAHIRPFSIIGHGCKVGAYVEIKKSLIMENTKVPHLAYIGDSILCEEVNVGAGTITANSRFDKAEVKMNVQGERMATGHDKLGSVIGGYAQTGINTAILPGVKIGARALIYPGSVVSRDVKTGEFYRDKGVKAY